MLAAAPASAAARGSAATGAAALTPLETVGIFVGIPVGLFVVISLLVALPAWAKDSRYRPDSLWDGEKREDSE